VRLWDGSSGIFQKSLPGPTEWQYAVALSHDGRLAAAGGWDGLVRVWDADKGTLRATLLQPPGPSPGQAQWLGLAPGGPIAGSPDLLPLVRWRVGGVEVPPAIPTARLVQPDQFARSLRGESVDAAFAKGRQ
jgi:WD40 repeat protein